jgi:transmembrane sensor
VFRATPLAVAVQEINHYAARKVRLGDPQLASLVVGGNFVAGDSESVVAAFAAALPVRVVDGGGELILFQRYEAESH